jgi:hypothetical protein
VFPTHLFVLGGEAIDVILGMSWMKLHKAVLDIAKQLVCIDSLIYGKVTLHLPVIVRLKASINYTVAKSIEEIPWCESFLMSFQMICQEFLSREILSSRLSCSPVLHTSPRVCTK